MTTTAIRQRTFPSLCGFHARGVYYYVCGYMESSLNDPDAHKLRAETLHRFASEEAASCRDCLERNGYGSAI